jgi:hypothetical protein
MKRQSIQVVFGVLVLSGLVVRSFYAVERETLQAFNPFQGESVEQFLTQAKFARLGRILGGVTRPREVFLEFDGLTRSAVWKTIDVQKAGLTQLDRGQVEIDFQDSWRTEIPAYELDKLLGLGMVPVTVERIHNGQRGSLQAWVEFVMSEADRVKKKIQVPDVEAWNEQIFKVRMFDNLIYNTDRHLNNIWITKDWKVILIDHSRTFRRFGELRDEKALTRFSRLLLAAMEKLDEPTLKERLGRYLNPYQIRGILQRRDRIVALAQKRAAEKGEAAVLFP